MKEKILIIDDEPDILMLLSSILQNEGYEVLTATDGLEGLEQFQEARPELVITDVKMPRKDGLTVLKEVEATPADVDVIILTGHSDEATAIECLRSGAYDYLLKPLEDLDVLLVSVKRDLYKRTLEMKNRQLIRQLEEMAVRDHLTGLLNFRQLNIYIEEEIARSNRYNHSFCGLMLDIDNFKEINRTYGHVFGDYVLEKLGELLRQNLRLTDHCFRYGNDEFFVILPETGEEKVGIAVYRLLVAIKNYTFICDDYQARITLSAGGVLYPDQARDKTEIIMHADSALCKAKDMGGDRILFTGRRSTWQRCSYLCSPRIQKISNAGADKALERFNTRKCQCSKGWKSFSRPVNL